MSRWHFAATSSVSWVAFGTKALADPALSAKVTAWLESFVKKMYQMEGTEDSHARGPRGFQRLTDGSPFSRDKNLRMRSDFAVAAPSLRLLQVARRGRRRPDPLPYRTSSFFRPWEASFCCRP